jgi:hypothetical protein
MMDLRRRIRYRVASPRFIVVGEENRRNPRRFVLSAADPDPAKGGRLMPNVFAYAMLLFWPLVALWLFKRLPRSEALIWTLVAGYLLLPVKTSIDLPLLPPLDKSTSPAFGALVMCLAGVGFAATRRRGRAASAGAEPQAAVESERPGWLPTSPLGKGLVFLVVLGPLASTLLNSDQINFSYGGFVKGMKLYDGLSAVLSHAVLIVPMLLARKYLVSTQDHRLILRILMLAGVAYSVPMLIEVRLSPQLNTWIYGFFQHSFAQTYRFGGYRPFVFLDHGLVVALFTAMVFLAAAALWRVAPRNNRGRALLAMLWLAFMLVMCRSVGSLALGAALAPMILILGRRTQILLATIIAIFVLLYPAIRGGGVITAPTAISVVEKLIPSKAGSLEMRLTNEDSLLERAAKRPVFGWGPWGRSRIYDDETGKDLSVTDGAWVIIIGEFGWAGYIGAFGLLTLPILSLFRLRADPALTLETSALTLILSLNLIDLLPNSGLTPITWLVAGSLLGRAEQVLAERSSRLSQRHQARRAISAAAPPEATPEPSPPRGAIRPTAGAVRGAIIPSKARIAPQQGSSYPRPTDTPTSRRAPPDRTRR